MLGVTLWIWVRASRTEYDLDRLVAPAEREEALPPKTLLERATPWDCIEEYKDEGTEVSLKTREWPGLPLFV